MLSDVSTVPQPRWQDEAGDDVVLPGSGAPQSRLRLEVPGVGPLLEIASLGGAVELRVQSLAALGARTGARRVRARGARPSRSAASRLVFTDGSGTDRVVVLPPISLDAGAVGRPSGSRARGRPSPPIPRATGGAAPALNSDIQQSAAPIPWAVKQPGFRVERAATGFQLPVEIAFLPNPGPGADDPLYYVSELYGTIKVVTRGGAVSDYATGLLNFDPTGNFPGSGEKGLAGIVVDPASGDVFAGASRRSPGVTDFHFPRVIRLHSTDGGRTAATRTTILDFPNEPVGASHQISSLSIGPDGKLYVHIGDGQLTSPAQDMTSVRGKILRVNLDGSAPADNPFYYAADGLTATDLIYASGFRNPFGGAWRASDGALWEVENGPSIDRLGEGRRRPQLPVGRHGPEHEEFRGVQLADRRRAGQHRVRADLDLRGQRVSRPTSRTTPSSRNRARPTPRGPRLSASA